MEEEKSTAEQIQDMLKEARAAKESAQGEHAEEGKVECPCCGAATLTRPVTVKGELLERFISCIITGVPFSNAYRLFGGRITVTVANPDNRSNFKLAQASSRILSGHSEDTARKALVNAMRTYMFIERVSVDSPEAAASLYPKAAVLETADAICGNPQLSDKDIEDAYSCLTDASKVSGIPSNTVNDLINTHVNIYNILLDSGFDSNFWKGIELA